MKNSILYILLFSAVTTVSSQKRKAGAIKKAELEETYYAKDSLCNAVYLYKERKTAFEFDTQTYSFNVITKVHEVIKIYTTDGFENATHIINYYAPKNDPSDEKVYKIKAYSYNLENGKIIKEKLSSKDIFQNQKNKYWATKTFTMPNINEGTIIEYSYKITSPYWSIRDLEFQHEIPVKQLHYTTEVPEYFKFNQQTKGYYYITPTVKYLNRSINWTNKTRNSNQGTSFQNEQITHSSKLTIYEDKHIPALQDNEPYINNIENYRGGIKYELSGTRFPNSAPNNYSTSWESVSETIFNSDDFGGQLNYSNYFKKDLEIVLKDKTTVSEKTIAIFEFVKSQVKWNGYRGKYTDKGVRKAYKEGSGNIAEINLMLVAMLREADLIANPVLLSTRDNGIPLFPTREGFNYVIAALHSEDSGYILLDASEYYSSPNNLPLRDINWNGRMIAKDGRSTSINLSSKTYSEVTNSLSITIDSVYNVSGILRRKLSGLKALNYRAKNNSTSEDDLVQKLENNYQVEISNFRFGNKETPYKPLTQLIQFKGSDMIEVINDKMYIDPLFFFTTKVNPFKLENRSFPVDYGCPWKEKNQISIKIPHGYKIESVPTSFGLGLPDAIGVYKFLIKTDNSTISIKTEEKINSAVISPQYYNDLKDYYSRIVSNSKEKIILSKI